MLQETVTVSAAQLNPGGVIALQRVVIDALVETSAHIPAGGHISRTVPPLTCDAPSKEMSVHYEEDESCAHHEQRPLLAWLLAMCARGLGGAFCDGALLALAFTTYVSLGLPTSGGIISISTHLALIAPLWKVFLLGAVTTIAATLEPLVFTTWLIGLRRVFVPLVADGDRASHSVGSIFLELALRSNEVLAVDFVCGLTNRTWLARAFGMRIAARGFMPLPKMDRPELVSIGDGAYTGGGNHMCTRQVDTSGATYRQIRIGYDSFVANSTVLMPGTSFGPRAVLGNRSVGVAGEDYSNGVFAGQKGKHALSDMPSSTLQPAHIRASSLRLFQTDPVMPLGDRPHQAKNEASNTATSLLLMLCILLLQAVDMVIGLVALLFERLLLGSSIVRIGIPLLFAFVLTPWLRLLWYLGATRLCKRSLVGTFSEEMSAKLGSRADMCRDIFVGVLTTLDAAIEPLKGSPIYNAMQRMLGAKVGPGVCWLGLQHVKSLFTAENFLILHCILRFRWLPTFVCLTLTGSPCAEPDMLTVGAGTVIAPGVDFFTHETTGHTSCFSICGAVPGSA